MSVILGIDPGQTGALVWLNTSNDLILGCSDHSAWCFAHDPPRELLILLKTFWTPAIIIIEKQHSRPKQGLASTANLMEYYGILRGCAAVLQCPVYLADPAVWKANMMLDSSKKTSIEAARKRWGPIEMFRLQKYHGRAEAALLAEYGKRFLPLPLAKERRVL